MATWTSAYLLTKTRQLAARGDNDTVTDAAWYQRLSDAQNALLDDIASRCPYALYSKAGYGSTPTLSTSDNQVFTFGTDLNSDPLFPIGKVMIYPSLAAIPDAPWVEGYDYLNEGNQIRIPNNRTYASTLYWRGIAPVQDITASVQPTILPPPSRILICQLAVKSFSEEGKRDFDLADRMKKDYDSDFAKWCLVWKTQFKSGGALAAVSGLRLAQAGVSISGSY
jgi:hypothetical protein